MEACGARSLVCVPLYDTLGPGAVNFIIDHAEIDHVFGQDKKAKELLNPACLSSQRLKSIVCFTSLTKEEKDKAANMGIKSYSWEEFLCLGKENPSEILPPKPFDICTIMYTSGTSGDPKGVVLTHETVALFVRGMDLFMDQFEDKVRINFYYPLLVFSLHLIIRLLIVSYVV
uniref:Long chain acyl-CoA synthetase 1 protein n=1 Tax=Rhizophora mucronata TaxID=61149 RepID=A0A2P2MP90_RHIMU